MTKKEIGDRLRWHRRNCHMTQKEVASLIGRSQQNIAHWEGGISQPDTDTLYNLARLYGVMTLDEFFGTNETDKEPTVVEKTLTKNIAFESLSSRSGNFVTRRANALMRRFLSLDEHGRRLVEQIADIEYTRCLANSDEQSNIAELMVYDTPASAGTGSYLDGDGGSLQTFENVPEGTDFGVYIQGDSMEPRLHDGDVAFVKAMPKLQSGDIGLFVLNNESFCKRLRIDRENKRVFLESLNVKYVPIRVKSHDTLRTVGKILGGVTLEAGR